MKSLLVSVAMSLAIASGAAFAQTPSSGGPRRHRSQARQTSGRYPKPARIKLTPGNCTGKRAGSSDQSAGGPAGIRCKLAAIRLRQQPWVPTSTVENRMLRPALRAGWAI